MLISSNWNGLEIATEKPISLRDKVNRIAEQEINNVDKSIITSLDTKLIIDLQPDEILIPNWTYSTSSGVVYNPIREKSLKTTKRVVLKKTKTADSNTRSVMQGNDRIPVGLISFHFRHSSSPSSERPATNSFEIVSTSARKSFRSSSIFSL